jgi:small multidrug resistance pump
MGYVYLALAIIAEVVATSALKSSQGFTRLIPSLVVVVGYAAAFYLLSIVLKTIPIGVAYAVWAGVGIALVTAVSAIAFDQMPDAPAVLGIALIISGVIVINVFSKMQVH